MPRSAKPPIPEPLSCLPSAPASDVKRLGWRGMMTTVRSTGKLLVTNHDQPEAVILPVDEYLELTRAAKQSEVQFDLELQQLRRSFDKRLAVLQDRSAASRLRTTMRGPAKLGGKLKVGVKY